MESCVGCDEVMIVRQVLAAAIENRVQVVDGREVAIDDRLVDQRPKVFGGLQLGRIGRQIDEPDALRHDEILLRVPSGAVKHEHNDTFTSGADRAGELGEQAFEEWLVDAVR